MNLKTTIVICLSLFWAISAQAKKKPERTALFDNDWRFYRGDAAGAEKSTFDDTQWRAVDLPHDWSIEDMPGTNSAFHPEAISGVSGGFTTGGIGWYRKTFAVPSAQKNKRVTLQFDGIYMNATVWLNGEKLGNWPYGYTSFWFDITDKIKPGEKNIIAVQVKNEGRNSRWYSGSGIYRHVWLKTTEPVHVAQWGTYITTPEVSAAASKVNIKTKVNNASSRPETVRLITRFVNAKGKEVTKTEAQQLLAAGASYEFNQSTEVKLPQLWSTETPNLYTAVTQVYINKRLQDQEETKFGIRSLAFDAQNGFRLNGQKMLLKGGCVHHDNGPLGARAYDRAEERRVELLKASGYNAIRTAHNPPSPAFLEACDRLGMLVIDEAFDTWKDRKNKEDYNLYFADWWQKDIDNMIYRDRNHPSIIMWSTGNEIPKRDQPEVAAVGKMLADHIRQLDASRPVTNGVNGIEENKDAFISALDVAGYNYARDKYVSEHQRLPQRIVYASESFTIEAFEYWMDVLDYSWVIGDFVWTAFDHIGEASIGWLGYKQNKNFYPWNLAYVGDIDICGWKRPQSYYRDALWQNGDNVSVFVKPPQPSFPETNPNPETWSKWNWHDVVADWTWPGTENQHREVSVFSSGEQVELFLNGKSLGKKPTTRATKFTATYTVPYQSGELQAVAYRGQSKIAETQLKTADQPNQLKLSADRKQIKADNQDLSYITVELLDAGGVRHPKADNLIKFELTGPGTIVGVGNANPKSIESNQAPQRQAWQGKCLVIVKADKKAGKITLKATADGLQAAEVNIVSK